MALLSNPLNCSRGAVHQGWCHTGAPEASAELVIHWGSCFPGWSQRDISWPQLILQRSCFVHGASLACRGPRAACDDRCYDSIGPSSRGCQNTVHLIQPPAIPPGCLQSVKYRNTLSLCFLFRLVSTGKRNSLAGDGRELQLGHWEKPE